jgi:RNA recognition motif-containing protein
MGTRLFIDNLHLGTTEEALRALFEGDGRSVLTVSIMSDRQSGDSHGYAFVEMGSAADALHARISLNGRDIHGQRLYVSEARPRIRSAKADT